MRCHLNASAGVRRLFSLILNLLKIILPGFLHILAGTSHSPCQRSQDRRRIKTEADAIKTCFAGRHSWRSNVRNILLDEYPPRKSTSLSIQDGSPSAHISLDSLFRHLLSYCKSKLLIVILVTWYALSLKHYSGSLFILYSSNSHRSLPISSTKQYIKPSPSSEFRHIITLILGREPFQTGCHPIVDLRRSVNALNLSSSRSVNSIRRSFLYRYLDTARSIHTSPHG